VTVNAAVFTCSICGEASVNICSYCTKDACSNHRCERCKRCSDCCECEYPLSAEEPAAVEAATDAVIEPAPEPVSSAADLLTPDELTDHRDLTEATDLTVPGDPTVPGDLTVPGDPTEPRA
jgi:transcription elongation factor Elf1